jgi:hypothetical protein
MWRRVLLVMLLGNGVAVGACGDTNFSSADPSDSGTSDGSISDASTADGSPNDDGSVPDGGIADASLPDSDLLTAHEDNPNDLVLRNGVLYWTTFSEALGLGGVRCMNADGTGGVSTVVRGTHANRLAVDDTQVYWTDNGAGIVPTDGFVGISSLDGGGGPSITGTEPPAGIAIDNDNVYIEFPLEQQIAVYAKSNQDFVAYVTSDLNNPVSIAVDSTGVTWTELGLNGNGLVSTGRLDGSVMGSTAPIDEPWGIALEGNQAFVTVRGLDSGPNQGSIDEIQRDGSTSVNLTGHESSPYFLAVDATNIYWTSEGAPPDYLNGTVRRIARTGGVPISLAVAQGRPHGIAIDATYVYWVNYVSGEIRRTKKF